MTTSTNTASNAAFFQKPAFWIICVGLLVALVLGFNLSPTPYVEIVPRDVVEQADGNLAYSQKGKLVEIALKPVTPEGSVLLKFRDASEADRSAVLPEGLSSELVRRPSADGASNSYEVVSLRHHYRIWSLFPALIAILLCWTTREPLSALLGGVVAGAFLLGHRNVVDAVIVQELATTRAAEVIILYLFLLGGILGIWSRTGASHAFAEWVSDRFVRGPNSARFVAWLLGVLFFQGGTVSTVLVGSTVKPLSDRHKISHEELAYIVDSTASPIASQIPLNAWPAYVQSFIFVAGVPFLATQPDRMRFYLMSILFCWYATFAVLQTLLFCFDKAPWVAPKLRRAAERARTTGELDAPDAEPMAAKELETADVPAGYKPSPLEFVVPLVVLIAVAIGTFIISGFTSLDIILAFTAALVCAAGMALLKGMRLNDLIGGFGNGLKGVVMGAMVLLLAISLGAVTKQLGAGTYVAGKLSDIPFWMLPVTLQLLTMLIAFSTGTSWGTYAVAFPLAMPLGWEIAQTQGVDNPYLLMMLCFAAVMDGSVFGDQCSPISDTTVLSSMCTGCDLMDHVKTQIPQALLAAAAAGICWTVVAAIFV